MRLTYVLGPSGSGKTTLRNRLVEDGFDHVTELDDVSACQMPTAGHTEWLRWRALEFLTKATRRVTDEPERRGEHHIVTGIVWPFHVLDSDAWDAALDVDVEVRFVLLDRPWHAIAETMDRRLVAEGWSNGDIREQLVLNERQARSLRRQVQALSPAFGAVIPNGDLDHARALLATSW